MFNTCTQNCQPELICDNVFKNVLDGLSLDALYLARFDEQNLFKKIHFKHYFLP